MKQPFLLVIRFYTKFISPLLHQLLGVKTACRYQETCSVYASRMISQYGILYGSYRAVRRILSCQSFIH
ncbi:MAG TPA: membrane protein insertion efficiency factor YidD [Patescibacteria group bacterium]|nr:membrane protein insertion efficiency factor YidD [Patescibacteria group bacterium]